MSEYATEDETVTWPVDRLPPSKHCRDGLGRVRKINYDSLWSVAQGERIEMLENIPDDSAVCRVVNNNGFASVNWSQTLVTIRRVTNTNTKLNHSVNACNIDIVGARQSESFHTVALLEGLLAFYY